MQTERTLILGIGNRIVGDDAIGLVVAERLYSEFVSACPDRSVDLKMAEFAGWRLIDLLQGYERVVIIDAMIADTRDPGECFRVTSTAQGMAHMRTSHGLGICEALKLAEMSGLPMPTDIAIYAITASRTTEFSEELSPQLTARISGITREILTDITESESAGTHYAISTTTAPHR